VVTGWPGSVHAMRVFNDAIEKYGDKFPHSPEGIHVIYDLFFAYLNYFARYLFKDYIVQEQFILLTQDTQTDWVTMHPTKYHVP